MASHVHLYPHFLVCDFEKAMYHYSNYGTVRLDEKWVKFAIHNFVSIVITTPKGEKTFFPKQIIKEGKKVKEVAVFFNPEVEMGAGRHTGHADGADDVALGNVHARVDQYAG